MVKRPSSPDAPMRTVTLPEGQRGAWFDGPDVVTMLRVVDSDIAFELPRDKKTFTLGSSPDRDVAIPEKFLSALHCLLERRGPILRVHDQGSRNGTYFDGRRESVFDLRPGTTFTAASIRFLALNDEMRAAYPVLTDILGADDEAGIRTSRSLDPTPSEVIVLATGSSHLLITGERGCDQARLARTIHGISLVRGRELVSLDAVPDDRREQRRILDQASRSTVLVNLEPTTLVMDAAFASMLFSPSFHVRVIAISPTADKAESVLGKSYVRSMKSISLRPLMQRTDAVPRLLDRMFVDRNSSLRFAELNAKNQSALQAHTWPGNLDELRVVADRLIAMEQEGSFQKAAKAVGVASSTLHHWFTQLGLSQPLTARA